METVKFDKVWSVPDESAFGRMDFMSVKDTGSLVITPDSIEFSGKKRPIAITQPLSVEKVQHWTKIDYRGPGGGVDSVLFTTAGWSGKFGGGKRLLRAIQDTLQVADVSDQDRAALQGRRQAERDRKYREGARYTRLGLILLGVGVLVTLGTLAFAAGRGGGTYWVAYGAILIGIVMLIGGAIDKRSARR